MNDLNSINQSIQDVSLKFEQSYKAIVVAMVLTGLGILMVGFAIFQMSRENG